MKKKWLTLTFAILVFSIPLLSIVNGRPITEVLKDLQSELKGNYAQKLEEQNLLGREYDKQHQRMVDVIAQSNELSLLLYTQEQAMTFDLAYALNKVSRAYKGFSKEKRPYDRVIHDLDIEIDRYARLIDALRLLPPVMKEIEVEILPDSLGFHVDSLDQKYSELASSLEREVIRIAVKDSLASPFVLDRQGEIYRDSCIKYASYFLRDYAAIRSTWIADSTHYQAAYLRTEDAYDYAQSRYRELEKYVFLDGQTPFLEILSDPRGHWDKVKAAMRDQYDFLEIVREDPQPADSVAAVVPEPSAQEASEKKNESDLFDGLSSKGANSILVLVTAIQLIALVIFWVFTLLILLLLSRIRKLRSLLPLNQLPLFSVLVGTVIYFLVLGFGTKGNEYIELGARHINTFLWLLLAITGSLLLRVKREQIHPSLRLYIPTFITAIIIIVCRIIFVPDRLMTFLFPPILAFVLVWWYFQLAVLLTILCLIDLLGRYKERWLDKRVEAMRNRITYVGGEDRESLLFGATWFYDFIRKVLVPALLLVSLPLCVHMSLSIFDFNDLYDKIFNIPFVQLVDKDGVETLRISGRALIGLLVLYVTLRYMNRGIHAMWQYVRYAAFMRKHKRTTIRDNEINLSLGNSIISVFIWMSYVVAVVAVLRKLMGGRLRVGDWIECDGVRGRVVAINYQCVVVETLEGTEMSFLNASLFGKNFNNLTRNNSYEFTKIVTGVAYGTDVKKVREVLQEAMKQVQTKDHYGRDIVEPQYGIKVVVADMADSSVNIAVKQHVLVPERIGYIDRAKEVIYDALNANGISIPFPQCDVHLVREEK